MNNSPKTYTVELVDGTFEGPKVITSDSMLFSACYFNRDDLPTVKRHDTLGQQGVYFLLRFDGDSIEKIYVEKTQVGIDRIVVHCQNSSKNWFQYCYLLTLNLATPASGNIFNSLERTYIDILKKNDGYECDNSQDNLSPLNSHDKIAVNDYKTQIDFLLQACGINIYQDVDASDCSEKLIFKIKRNGLNARMQYIPNEGKLIVLDGSEVDMRRTADSVIGDAFRRRMELFNGSKDIEFLGCDVDFYSASAASSFVIGNSSNGKVDWVFESDGKTPLKDFLE